MDATGDHYAEWDKPGLDKYQALFITDRNEVIHTHNIHMYDMKEEGRYLGRERGVVRGGTGEDNGGK